MSLPDCVAWDSYYPPPHIRFNLKMQQVETKRSFNPGLHCAPPSPRHTALHLFPAFLFPGIGAHPGRVTEVVSSELVAKLTTIAGHQPNQVLSSGISPFISRYLSVSTDWLSDLGKPQYYPTQHGPHCLVFSSSYWSSIMADLGEAI